MGVEVAGARRWWVPGRWAQRPCGASGRHSGGIGKSQRAIDSSEEVTEAAGAETGPWRGGPTPLKPSDLSLPTPPSSWGLLPHERAKAEHTQGLLPASELRAAEMKLSQAQTHALWKQPGCPGLLSSCLSPKALRHVPTQPLHALRRKQRHRPRLLPQVSVNDGTGHSPQGGRRQQGP